MVGTLKIVQVKECQGYPCVMLKLVGTDSAGNERDTVFEYELPFNFKFENDLSR